MAEWFERLRELREKKGFRQEELAEKSGLTQGLISGLERGKKKFTQNNLDSILSVLGKSYHDVFCQKTKEELELELKVMETKLRISESKNHDDNLGSRSGTQIPASRTGLKKKVG